MSQRGPLSRLARAAGAHPWVTLLAWVVVLGITISTAILGLGGESLFERLKTTAPTSTSESSRADQLLDGSGDADEAGPVTLLVWGVDLDEPQLVATGEQLAERFGDDDFVDPLVVRQLTGDDLPPAAQPLFANDERGVLFVVSSDSDDVVELLTEHRDELRSAFPDATVEVGSADLLEESIVSISSHDLERGETVALPIALLVMLVVFGGFLAAGVPLVGAIAAIIGALGALFGFSYLMDIDTTVINVITAVGLGLSIDYGLLMVSRFREEYRRLRLPDDGPATRAERRTLRLQAIGRTAETAGRTVLYSGITFAIASAGLLVFEPRVVRAIGIGALSVTVIAIASALTLVPALLGISGDRLVRPGALAHIPGLRRVIRHFGDIAPAEGVFSRLTRRVQRHPALITVLCALALIALATPALSLRLANTSADGIPDSSTQAVFVDTIAERFPDASSPRIELVTETEADATAWAADVETIPAVESVGTPVETDDAWRTVVRVEPIDGVDIVDDVRESRPDESALVTGMDARTVDFTQSLIDRAPLAILIIALGTIALLFLMTGSLVVPLKALLASALSLGATIGILVWGFQFGNFAGVMSFDPGDVLGVDPLVLVLVLAFGFGLAMDYEMFIISRVKEAVDTGIDGREAIAHGLQRSGRIITSAALTIVVVFTGFATGDLMVIKQLGVALAVAIILDATLVRLLLVPAVMTWQLKIMWWAPRWMKRIHARWGLREG